MISDYDDYIVRCKTLKIMNEQIAAKIGYSPREVEDRWKEIQKAVTEVLSNGSGDLTHQFTMLCYQYQLLGESLKIIGMALSNTATAEDIKEKCPEISDEMNQKLRFSFIILRPFVPKSPEKSLEESIDKAQKAN